MIEWYCGDEVLGPQARHAFATLENTFALSGEEISRAPLSHVIRVSLDGRRYYVKRYTGAAKNALRARIGVSRVESEWENLERFADWGIPTATVVARGLERKRKRFVRGAMVTEEIPATDDLARLAKGDDGRLRDRAWLSVVMAAVARDTRTMHARRFAHNDLKWRNILVDRQVPPRTYWIDCPSGAFWWGPFLRYRIVKDLACLDKVARLTLRRSQRLRFFLDYRQHQRLDAGDKRLLRKVLRFFSGRE